MNRSLALYLWVLVLCLWLGCAQAADPFGNVSRQAVTPSPSSGEAPAPALHIPESSFDFGEVAEGSEVSHDFTVRNTGKEVLQINQVTPG